MAIILLLDNEKPIRTLICEILSKEHLIIEASTGNEALDIIRRITPNLVILDLMLDKSMSGQEFYYQFRCLPDMDIVPVLIISGYAERDVISDAFAKGARSFLSKPLEPEVLKKTVKEIVAKEVPRRIASRLMASSKSEIEEALKLVNSDTLMAIKTALVLIEAE